jgi:hypothetical protein
MDNRGGKSVYDDLSFEAQSENPSPGGQTAEAPGAAAFSCAVCGAGITGEYFMSGERAVCAGCQPRVTAELAQGHGGFGPALLYGTLAGAAGTAVYYGVQALTGYEFGLIAIIVGLAVGKAVRHGAGTRDHWLYRALGVGITYASICTTYVPPLLASMENPGLVHVIIAFLFALKVPYFLLTEGEIMGLVILGIGLWEGWRYSQAPEIALSGPFRVAQSATKEAPAAT